MKYARQKHDRRRNMNRPKRCKIVVHLLAYNRARAFSWAGDQLEIAQIHVCVRRNERRVENGGRSLIYVNSRIIEARLIDHMLNFFDYTLCQNGDDCKRAYKTSFFVWCRAL